MSPDKSLQGTKYTKLGKSSIRFEHAISIIDAMKRFVGDQNHEILVDGGRENGLVVLKRALRNQSHYQASRDQFTYETTFLSAYIKFGCVSIREVYWSISKKYGRHSGLIREILWREFFAHILFVFPSNLKQAYLEKYRHLPWKTNSSFLVKWKEGKTGFPLVDACMRQLLETGYMHNRGRMVVATFLTKTLLLNWRLGEAFFAQKLTDYDQASNNGNWQSIASVGTDMKPYYRDMNPWIQAKKFDPDCEYIRRWVPELADVPTRDILNWDTAYEKHKGIYLKPIVVYEDQKQDMMDIYR
jgi:deoxyribodipyrimidine photo-lyase